MIDVCMIVEGTTGKLPGMNDKMEAASADSALTSSTDMHNG